MTLAITHVLAPAMYGGLETVVELLSHGQADAGDRVTVVGVFTKDPLGHQFWSRLTQGPVHAVPLVVGRRNYGAERSAVRRVLVETGSQILHTHGYRADVLHAPVARRLGVATVATVHGFSGRGWKNRVYEWTQRRALRRFDSVVAVSKKLGEDLVAAGVPKQRVRVIRNAWRATADPLPRSEARAALGLAPEVKHIGWVGRLTPEKGPEVMVQAFAKLRDRDVRLSLIGDGAMRSELGKLAERSGVGPLVDWHGAVPGAARYLRAFDVLAITSWTEGTPMILLEAMAAEVPIVATAVGGIPDAVSSKEACLVAAGDVGGIAGELERVLAGPPVSDLVDAAKERLAREFMVGPWLKRYRAIYNLCMSQQLAEPG